MNEINENFDYDDGTEDEDSPCCESVIGGFITEEEDFGTLSFGMEKSEAKMLIETLFEVVTQIDEAINVQKKLLDIMPVGFDTIQNIDEILDYAVKSEILELKDGCYMRIN